MKKKLILMAFLAGVVAMPACQSDNDDEAEKIEKAESLDPTSIEFEEMEHNFGTVTEGEKAEHSFTFTNTGENELIIVDAKASCGCTVPSFSKEPIPPGGTGNVDVVFNSAGKMGEVKKSVTVIANTNPSKNVLYMVGKIEE